MFGSLGWSEILVLALIGLVVFGPERLPQVIKDARNLAREMMTMARSARDDLQAELGPEMADLDLRSLHPKNLVRDALLGDDDDNLFNHPLLGGEGKPKGPGPTVTKTATAPAVAAPTVLAIGERAPWDSDAT